jgi:hypothetical protein
MAIVKNPNEIVEELVADFRTVFGTSLISVIMYGSAVTHEYRPGKSDINIAIVLENNSAKEVIKASHICKKWMRKKVSIPFFMTKEYITNSLDTFPIEFLDMQNNHRVLSGEDLLARISISPEHLRIQCERELKSAALHLRSGYIRCTGKAEDMRMLLSYSSRSLFPILKALLVLAGRAVPSARTEVVLSVEDVYKLKSSSVMGAFEPAKSERSSNYKNVAEKLIDSVDLLINRTDVMNTREVSL